MYGDELNRYMYIYTRYMRNYELKSFMIYTTHKIIGKGMSSLTEINSKFGEEGEMLEGIES